MNGRAGEHYECSRDAAIRDGAAADQADKVALTALGDAKRANRQYRKVLLTSWKRGCSGKAPGNRGRFARGRW
jgi:hypothetical protein